MSNLDQIIKDAARIQLLNPADPECSTVVFADEGKAILAGEVVRLRACLRSCRIALNDGYSREAVILDISKGLGGIPYG